MVHSMDIEQKEDIRSLHDSACNLDNSSGLKCVALEFLGNQPAKIDVKSFVVPNIFGTKSAAATPKTFAIPSVFGTNSPLSVPNFFRPHASDTTAVVEAGILPEQAAIHLKTDEVTKALSDLQLHHPSESQCLTAGIDLSVALKPTGSLPNLGKGKRTVSERFDIPFIDGDVSLKENSKKAPVKRTSMTYSLDIRDALKVEVRNCKRPSKLGRVIIRKYRHKREKSLSLPVFCSPYLNAVRRFKFTTESPDDYISSHLKGGFRCRT